jgi:hypothetical protein
MDKLYLSLIVAVVLPTATHAGWKTFDGRRVGERLSPIMCGRFPTGNGLLKEIQDLRIKYIIRFSGYLIEK